MERRKKSKIPSTFSNDLHLPIIRYKKYTFFTEVRVGVEGEVNKGRG